MKQFEPEISETQQALLRQIPSVEEVLQWPEVRGWLARHPRPLVLEAIRDALAARRAAILKGGSREESPATLLEEAGRRLASLSRPSLRPVINATGVVLHTNLGRAVLSPAALARLQAVAGGYSNLEYDLEAGQRGKRFRHLEPLLCRLTGGEAAFVVNNNAAAVLLVLNTLAQGREVIVSRGELVEIGGSFRIPEVLERSGARLREVGTTNKTRLRDYERAITDQTALLLKVHTSNYRIVGFVQEVSVAELVALGRERQIPVVHDLGSGTLVDLRRYGAGEEPTVQESLQAGADLVTFSGDKLLGGPQAGIIVGRYALVDRLRANPLARALRMDKLTLAALEATLQAYHAEDRAVAEIPALRMLCLPLEALKERAERLTETLRGAAGAFAAMAVQEETSQAGGGSLPLAHLPTFVVALSPRVCSAGELEARLRRGDPPVIARIKEGRLLLDPRTILDGQEPILAQAVRAALAS